MPPAQSRIRKVAPTRIGAPRRVKRNVNPVIVRTITRPATATRSTRTSATHSVAAPSTLASAATRITRLSQLSKRYRAGWLDTDAIHSASARKAAKIAISRTVAIRCSSGAAASVSIR